MSLKISRSLWMLIAIIALVVIAVFWTNNANSPDTIEPDVEEVQDAPDPDADGPDNEPVPGGPDAAPDGAETGDPD